MGDVVLFVLFTTGRTTLGLLGVLAESDAKTEIIIITIVIIAKIEFTFILNLNGLRTNDFFPEILSKEDFEKVFLKTTSG